MTVSLESIATQLRRVLEELQPMRREPAEVETEVGDAMTVLTGMVPRHSRPAEPMRAP